MEERAPRRRDRLDALAIGVVTVLCAAWGVNQVAIKVAANDGLPPLLQGAMRGAAGAALVCLFVLWRHGRAQARALFQWDAAALPGLCVGLMFGVEFAALYPGLDLTTASRGVIFLYTSPFFTALGVHFLLPNERLGVRQCLGLLVAFSGVAATIADRSALGGGRLAGDLLCVAAGFLWGATTVLVKANPNLLRAPPTRLLFFQLAGSAPVMLAASLLVGEHADWGGVTALAWASLLYQTVPVAFASYLAWLWLVLAYPAGRLAGFTFLTPLFGILAGVALLGEHATLALLAGLAGIAIGLPLINSKGRTR
jgi:drug/metabolite transporter (DMT)-like permease